MINVAMCPVVEELKCYLALHVSFAHITPSSQKQDLSVKTRSEKQPERDILKPGQMSIDSPGLYVPEQNRLFLAGFKLKCAWRRRFLFRRFLPTRDKHHLTRFHILAQAAK